MSLPPSLPLSSPTQSTGQSLASILRKPGVRKRPFLVRSIDDALLAARVMGAEALAPIFLTSAVTGAGLDLVGPGEGGPVPLHLHVWARGVSPQMPSRHVRTDVSRWQRPAVGVVGKATHAGVVLLLLVLRCPAAETNTTPPTMAASPLSWRLSTTLHTHPPNPSAPNTPQPCTAPSPRHPIQP
jgi:hypothetical protein